MTHTTVNIDLAEIQRVEHHCNHEDGTASWRIDYDGMGCDSLYLTGTVDQLKAFRNLIQKALEAEMVKAVALPAEAV